MLPARTTRVLEDAATAGLVEGGPLLSPAEELSHLIGEPLLPFCLERDVGLQDDETVESAATVGEWHLAAHEPALMPLAVDNEDSRHYFRPLPTVASGVHVDAAAHASRHTHELVQPGPPRLRGASGCERTGQTCPEPPALARRFDPVKALAQSDHQRVETAVGKEERGGGKRNEARVSRGPADRQF